MPCTAPCLFTISRNFRFFDPGLHSDPRSHRACACEDTSSTLSVCLALHRLSVIFIVVGSATVIHVFAPGVVLFLIYNFSDSLSIQRLNAGLCCSRHAKPPSPLLAFHSDYVIRDFYLDVGCCAHALLESHDLELRSKVPVM